jgi:hypothetical protein
MTIFEIGLNREESRNWGLDGITIDVMMTIVFLNDKKVFFLNYFTESIDRSTIALKFSLVRVFSVHSLRTKLV